MTMLPLKTARAYVLKRFSQDYVWLLLSALVFSGCGVVDLFADFQASREDANRQTTSDLTPAAAVESSGGLRLGEADQAVATSAGDKLGPAFFDQNQDLTFLFTQLSDGDGLVLSAKHQADFYFAIDVSRTMTESRESLIQNLGMSLAFLASQSFQVSAKIMKFSQLCWAKAFVSPPQDASVQEYKEYLSQHITEAMPKAGDVGWDCDASLAKTNVPEMAFEAISKILLDIKKEYDDTAQSGLKRYPVVVVVTDNPSAAQGYTPPHYDNLSASYKRWAQEMGRKLARFSYLAQLRFYASIGSGEHVQTQYKTVLDAAKAASPPLADGSSELAFPLSDRSFLQLVSMITTAAAKDAPLQCLLMGASARSNKNQKVRTTTWSAKAIKKSGFKLGLVSWKEALKPHTYPITVTEKRCCIAGGAELLTLGSLPTQESKCQQVIQAQRVLEQS